MLITLDNDLPCRCEPRLVGAWQSHCEAGAYYSWTEGPRLEIASSLSLLAMTKKSVAKVLNEDKTSFVFAL
jgi:hypothetical protein